MPKYVVTTVRTVEYEQLIEAGSADVAKALAASQGQVGVLVPSRGSVDQSVRLATVLETEMYASTLLSAPK